MYSWLLSPDFELYIVHYTIFSSNLQTPLMAICEKFSYLRTSVSELYIIYCTIFDATNLLKTTITFFCFCSFANRNGAEKRLLFFCEITLNAIPTNARVFWYFPDTLTVSKWYQKNTETCDFAAASRKFCLPGWYLINFT